MRELADLGEQARLDRLAPREAGERPAALGVDEHVDRLEPGRERRGDEILALAGEQPELAAAAPGLEPPQSSSRGLTRR